MKVLILIPCLLNGGTEMQTFQLASTLVKLNYEVEIISYFEYNELIVQKFKELNLKVHLLNFQRSIKPTKFIKELKNEIKNINPNFVHIQYMAPGFLTLVATKLAFVKKIYVTIHQPYTKSHKMISKILVRLAAFFSTKFVCVSLNTENSWFGSSRLFNSNSTSKKHFTIYNSIDLNKIDNIINSTRKNYYSKQTSEIITIGALARMRHEKGIDILIESFKILKTKYSNIDLLLIGDGPNMNDYKKLVNKSNLNQSIHFLGELSWEDAIYNINNCDIVVTPSRFEGFGLSTAESMALHKPIVASNVDGLKEVVSEFETGLFFSNENINDLVSKIELLILDTELRIEYGNNARKRINEKFTSSNFEVNISKLYLIK